MDGVAAFGAESWRGAEVVAAVGAVAGFGAAASAIPEKPEGRADQGEEEQQRPEGDDELMGFGSGAVSHDWRVVINPVAGIDSQVFLTGEHIEVWILGCVRDVGGDFGDVAERSWRGLHEAVVANSTFADEDVVVGPVGPAGKIFKTRDEESIADEVATNPEAECRDKEQEKEEGKGDRENSKQALHDKIIPRQVRGFFAF
jgi:hypothetical protein